MFNPDGRSYSDTGECHAFQHILGFTSTLLAAPAPLNCDSDRAAGLGASGDVLRRMHQNERAAPGDAPLGPVFGPGDNSGLLFGPGDAVGLVSARPSGCRTV